MAALYHIPNSIYGYEREFGVIFPLISRQPCNEHICLKRQCYFCLFTFFTICLYIFVEFSQKSDFTWEAIQFPCMIQQPYDFEVQANMFCKRDRNGKKTSHKKQADLEPT